MRGKLAVVIVALLVAGGTLIALIIGSPSATAATTLTVIEHAASDHVTDVGKTGLGRGDLLTFHNQIYDSTDITVVGSDQGSCIRITKFKSNKKGSWECMWTTFLESGSIVVETPFYDTGLSVGAITGGTGTYVGAGGSLDLSCTKTKCTFTFNLA